MSEGIKKTVPIYDITLYIATSVDYLISKFGQGFIDHQKENVGENYPCYAGVAISPKGETVVYMLVDSKQFKSKESFLQTICHEAIHAAWSVLDLAMVKVDRENHEALAYLTDWIFRETLKLDGPVK